jgi:hypothetical protein
VRTASTVFIPPSGIRIIKLFLKVIAIRGKFAERVNTGYSARKYAIGRISVL